MRTRCGTGVPAKQVKFAGMEGGRLILLFTSLSCLASRSPAQAIGRLLTARALPPSRRSALRQRGARGSRMACAAPPKRLLFVGDSLTYVNDLDQRVAELAREAGFAEGLVVDRVVKGGAPLKKLWTKTKVKSVIKGSQAADGGETAPWDAVILQEDLPETDLTTFHSFVDKFHHHIAGT